MKQKILALMVVTLLAVSLIACGKTSEEKNNEKENVQEEMSDNSQELRAELSSKLDISVAWSAVASYGQEKYGAFSVQYQPGSRVEEIAEDADTWFLKASCTLNGEVQTCEARVTGTTENPEVVYFEMY